MNARYRLVESIGQGGMGRVWRAVDEMLDRLVAVKEIRVDGQAAEDSGTHRERTLREARATARIDHPNVVRVYDVVDEGQRLWIVMELVTGRSLERIMTEEGPLSPRETARIGLGLVAALRQVHAGGVLHRDIKPGNVLVETGAGRVVLTDFGIAAIQDAKALTMVGMLVGSPDYMAPERISGRRQGPPSDLWSLGATLSAALAGNSPFTRDTTLATLHAVLYEEPRLPPTAGPLHPLLGALLAKDPSHRPGLSEVERALRVVMHPSPTPTVPLGEVPVAGEVPVVGDDGPVMPGPTMPGVTAPGLTVPGLTVPGLTVPGSTGPAVAGAGPTGAASAPGVEPVTPGPVESGPSGAGTVGPESGGVPVPGGNGSADVGGGHAPGDHDHDHDHGPARVGGGPRTGDPGPAPVSGGHAPPDHGHTPVGSGPGPAGGRGGLLAAPDEAVPGGDPVQQSAGALGRAGAVTRRRAGAPFEPAGAPEGQDGPHFRRTALLAVLGVVAIGVVIAVLAATSGGGGRREEARGGTATASSPRVSDSGAVTPTGSPTGSPTVDGTSRPHSPPPGSRTEAGGFAWIPPQGWRRDVKTGAEVHYTSPDGRQELVGKSSLARGDLLDTWKRSEESARQGRDYVKIRLAETRFQGYPAVVWEYTFTLKGTPWHARLLGFDADGKSYQINTWYQPETERQAISLYDRVKASFMVL
ncbi:protein kinase [Streptomyces sp. NPDC016566]|uniref:serine/threonine protein kinase n=1 Tax=Streptomyces sp. NPDC016566 TaxID=3364967 RepID=UPI0036FA0559